MENGEFIPIYVPRPLLGRVYELIVGEWRASGQGGEPATSKPTTSSAKDQSDAAASAAGGQAPSPAGAGSSSYVRSRDADEAWPDELLRQAYEESPTTMRTLLDVMAEHPGEEFNTLQFADELGFTGPRATWRVPGVLGAFTKRMNRRYERKIWPFAWRKENGQFIYWMPASVATKIRSFRNGG
jgi:Family of unknown function (DUF6416)